MEISRRHFTAKVKYGGEPIRMARGILKMSQAQVAKRAGVSRQIIGFLEGGTRGCCNPETASAISEALSVPFTSLFQLEALHVEEAAPQKRAA